MKGNFYSNPLKLIWIARLNLLPVYLFIIWILICCILLLGSIIFDFINFESFNIANFFTASITGLTFTLAIFTAERNVFKIDELKVLAEYKGEKDKYEGKALLEFFGPFVFTALIFLTTGLLALIVPFINVRVCSDVSDFFIQSYLDILVLGLFSLFNLVVTILNDVYHAINRES